MDPIAPQTKGHRGAKKLFNAYDGLRGSAYSERQTGEGDRFPDGRKQPSEDRLEQLGSSAADTGSEASGSHEGETRQRPPVADEQPAPAKASKTQQLAQAVTKWTGSTPAFATAFVTVLIWAITGPIFRYSDTWQLVMNTASSIVTFLMVFLIQRSQNKDALAVHVKLNEIVKAIAGASNHIVNVEDLSEAELLRLQERYQLLAKKVAESSRPTAADAAAQLA